MYSEKDYEHLVDALLPRGPIWHRKKGGVLDSILFALSSEAARIDARARALVDESDPRTSVEELERWFEDHGIPSDCVAAIADPSLEQMRQELIAKITSNSGLTAKFFEELAAVLGYTATVTTFESFTCASACNQALYDERWRTSFVLGIAFSEAGTAKLFDTTWSVDQPLARWGNALLECLIRALAPAHVDVIFMYGGEENA